jgi:heterodisulfide reductase subunit D
MDAPALGLGLQSRITEILDRCTSCGACVEVCPMPGPAGLDTGDPRALAGGVLTILRGGTHNDAARWAAVCSGSGHCIPACAHGVNPRFMLAMARLAGTARAESQVRRKTGFAAFGAMTAGVRVLSRLQLPPDLLARFRPDDDAQEDSPQGVQAEPPDVVFYTGCNLMKTPHIALLCLDIMDAIGVRYRVMGGPSHCCGVLQFRAGDLATAERISFRTIDRLAKAAPRALSWCPTCQIQLGENIAPSRNDPFDMSPFVRFLAERLEILKPLLIHKVSKRVGLHEHPGVAGITEAAQTILRAIPGLDFVELEQTRVGYMCNSLNALPAFKRDLHRHQLEAAKAAGVTTLAGIYHTCHRELCSHELDWPFEVVNFLELVGESMGSGRPDLFKRLKMMQDVDAILVDSAAMLDVNHLSIEEARGIILDQMLAEQSLPLQTASGP